MSDLKLDLGCGQRPREGYEGVDIAPGEGVAHVVDLFSFPWPFETGSVAAIHTSHLVEHIPHGTPGQPDLFLQFWDEAYRILRKPTGQPGDDDHHPGGRADIIHPYSRSDRAFWDPTHTRYIHEMTWYYLDREWRVAQGLDHYPVSCDFRVVTIDAALGDQNFQARSREAQEFQRAHYFNVIHDLSVILEAR